MPQINAIRTAGQPGVHHRTAINNHIARQQAAPKWARMICVRIAHIVRTHDFREHIQYALGVRLNGANVDRLIDVLLAIMTGWRPEERLQVYAQMVDLLGEDTITIHQLHGPIRSAYVAVVRRTSGHIEAFDVLDFPLVPSMKIVFLVRFGSERSDNSQQYIYLVFGSQNHGSYNKHNNQFHRFLFVDISQQKVATE